MTEITVKQMVHNHEKAFKPEAAEGLDAVIQYNLSGEEAGDYIITIKDGKCTVAEGIYPNPSMTMTADAHDFRDVLLGRVNGMQYFMMGKLKLAGDLNLAMKLTTFFKMTGS
jgi:putative sterol carrier protein